MAKEKQPDYAIRKAAMKRKWEDALRLKERRPYIMLFAVDDSRDTPECLAMHKVVVHIDSPWLQSHLPPHHKTCRCGMRTLNERQMEKEKLTITNDNNLP